MKNNDICFKDYYSMNNKKVILFIGDSHVRTLYRTFVYKLDVGNNYFANTLTEKG